jgi:hypothetical protein
MSSTEQDTKVDLSLHSVLLRRNGQLTFSLFAYNRSALTQDLLSQDGRLLDASIHLNEKRNLLDRWLQKDSLPRRWTTHSPFISRPPALVVRTRRKLSLLFDEMSTLYSQPLRS